MMKSTTNTDTAATSSTSHVDPPAADQTNTATTQDQQQQQQLMIKKPVEYLDSFPVGYRFLPTDEEILHYLTLRHQKKELPPNRINEVNLYDHHPKYLTSPGRFKAYENKEWYFFTPRDRKYPNGERPKRSAGTGFWKATGTNKIVLFDEITKKELGSKKTLVFYEGKTPGDKTDWVMNEYKLEETSIQKNSRPDMLLDDSVLCRIHIKKEKKSQKKKKSKNKKSVVEEDDHLQEEEEEKEKALSDREATNDMEDEHLICSNYDSIMQQYNYPTDHHHILNNNSTCNSTSAYSSNVVMGAVSSSSTTKSIAVRGVANIMPPQACLPTAPILLDDFYMDTSGGNIVAPNMVSMSATHNTHGQEGYDDQIQQWDYSDLFLSSLSSLVPGLPAGHPPLPDLSDQQWVSSLSSCIPSGHPPLSQVLKVPQQGYSLPSLPQMQQLQPQMQQQGYHHQYTSSWAHGNNNIDDSSSGINKLLDHAIRRECRERHMVSKDENDNNSTTEHSKYFSAGENLESFDQALPFSKNTFNGSSTLPDCGWSRSR